MNSSMKALLGSLAVAAVAAVAALTASTAVSAHPTGNAGGSMMDQGMTKSGAMPGGMKMHQGQMSNRHMMMQQGSMHQGGHGGHGGHNRHSGQGGHGMMGSKHMGKGHHMDGVGKMGRMRVPPVQHLTVDDVRHFFGHHLERHDNKRLKLGEVKQRDEDTITAQIVTVDGSLVQAFEVDRYNGIAKRID